MGQQYSGKGMSHGTGLHPLRRAEKICWSWPNVHQRFHAPSLYTGPPGWNALDDGCELWFGWHRSCPRHCKAQFGELQVVEAGPELLQGCRNEVGKATLLQLQGCFLPASSSTACRRERAGGIHRCEDGRRVSLMGAGIQGSDLYVRSQDVSHQHLFFGGERA